MQVEIPFKERFREPMINGIKTMTSRTKIYGQAGDWFNAFGKTFVLTSVVARHFDFIVDHWKEEGCNSKMDFLEVWRGIHPRKALNMQDVFFTHTFQDISTKSTNAISKSSPENPDAKSHLNTLSQDLSDRVSLDGKSCASLRERQDRDNSTLVPKKTGSEQK